MSVTRAMQVIVAVPLAFVVGGHVLLWGLNGGATALLSKGTRPSVEPQLTDAACSGCAYTVGEERAVPSLTPEAAKALVLAPADVPPGFTMTSDDALSSESIAHDDQQLQQLSAAGHLAGWWREYVNEAEGVRFVSGANIYRSVDGAKNWSTSDTPASWGAYSAKTKFRTILADTTLGDESSAYVAETADGEDPVAYVFIRVGHVNVWLALRAPQQKLQPQLFLGLIYNELAHLHVGSP